MGCKGKFLGRWVVEEWGVDVGRKPKPAADGGAAVGEDGADAKMVWGRREDAGGRRPWWYPSGGAGRVLNDTDDEGK